MNPINPDTMARALELAEALEAQGCLMTVHGLYVLYEALDKPGHSPAPITTTLYDRYADSWEEAGRLMDSYVEYRMQQGNDKPCPNTSPVSGKGPFRSGQEVVGAIMEPDDPEELIDLLLAGARHEHSDMSIMADAAEVIKELLQDNARLDWLADRENHIEQAVLQSPEIQELRKDAERAKRLTNDLSKIIHDMTVAQQSAWIEWRHGKGSEAAMAWVHNGLAGPGSIPDEDEPYGKEPQAWYDANRADPFPQCFCGRPSSILWMGQGFCCHAHYQETKDRFDADASMEQQK